VAFNNGTSDPRSERPVAGPPTADPQRLACIHPVIACQHGRMRLGRGEFPSSRCRSPRDAGDGQPPRTDGSQGKARRLGDRQPDRGDLAATLEGDSL
jgi:hypothetical protein